MWSAEKKAQTLCNVKYRGAEHLQETLQEANLRMAAIQSRLHDRMNTTDILCLQECPYSLFDMLSQTWNGVYSPRLLEGERGNIENSKDGAAIFTKNNHISEILSPEIDKFVSTYNRGKPLCIAKYQGGYIISLHIDKHVEDKLDFLKKVVNILGPNADYTVAGDFNEHFDLTNPELQTKISTIWGPNRSVYVSDTHKIQTMRNETFQYRIQIDYVFTTIPTRSTATFNCLAPIYLQFNTKNKTNVYENQKTEQECKNYHDAQKENHTHTTTHTNIKRVTSFVFKLYDNIQITHAANECKVTDFITDFLHKQALSDHFLLHMPSSTAQQFHGKSNSMANYQHTIPATIRFTQQGKDMSLHDSHRNT